MKYISDKAALALLKLGEFFIMFMLITPVIVLLYQEKGITLGEFFLIQGLFRIAAFLFEIPSGYLSDTFSRRKILLIGSVVWFMSMAGLFWAYGFWQIAAAEMGLGLASALFSGTKEAYAYDLLKRMKRAKDFLKENGSINSLASIATFIAAIIGGALYPIVGDWIVAIEAAAAFLAVICMWYLPELREIKRKIAPESSPLKDIMGIVKMSVKHPEIQWFMLFPAIFGSFTLVLFWGLQPTMAQAGIAVGLFGLFVGFNQGMRAVFSKFADPLYKKFGYKKFLGGSIVVILIGIASVFGALSVGGNIAFAYIFCIILAIIPATQTMSKLVFNTYIHHRIKSNERGTVLSVAQMYSMFISGGIMILMQPILDGFGIKWAMAALLILLPILLWPMFKIMRMKNIDLRR